MIINTKLRTLMQLSVTHVSRQKAKYYSHFGKKKKNLKKAAKGDEQTSVRPHN